MNGEERKYLDERFDKLENETREMHDAVLKLPCQVHIEKIKGLSVSIDRSWKFIYGIIISVVLSGTTLVFLRTIANGK